MYKMAALEILGGKCDHRGKEEKNERFFLIKFAAATRLHSVVVYHTRL